MSGQPFRLADGGLIDRSKPLTFSFDGKPYQGFAGDTLASALLANGVHLLARSFKYHRPRGILTAGAEEPSALVTVGRGNLATPNQPATQVRLHDGLEAFAQNCWPSLTWDIQALTGYFWRLLTPGFYYKTFMGPPGNWMLFEPFVRASAGLGKSPSEPDGERYEHTNRHCDVLVIGGGPAGLVAARQAAQSGARVILAEDSGTFGGHALALPPEGHKIAGKTPRQWIDEQVAVLSAQPETLLLSDCCGFGYHADNWVVLCQTLSDHQSPAERSSAQPRQRLWRVRAQQVVLATGAIERPLVFHNNDRPGIMLCGAVRQYLHHYGVLPGRRAVIFTNNSDGWNTAFDLAAAGASVAAVIDTRSAPEPTLVKRARELGIAVHSAATITDTYSNAWGNKHITGIEVAAQTADGGVVEAAQRTRLDCDLLAVSGGWTANVALFSQSRGKLSYDQDLATFRPLEAWQAQHSVGGANGVFQLADTLAEAAEAGRRAAQQAGFEAPKSAASITVSAPGAVPYTVREAWSLPTGRPAAETRAFVDYQNDLSAKDLHLAVQEGYESVEHAKRYCALGMGSDQGKTSNLNGFGILAQALGKTIPEVGVTTFRAPYKPITFGAVAGQYTGPLFHPRRTTPMQAWHQEAGATFEIVGDWLRPRTYCRPAESFEQAVQRESLAARQAVGVLDASTLGKIDIRGRDARQFINRIYSNAWLKLSPGHCRYGLMLNEDGMVMDDGVTACLADDHFHMTTTTGGAAHVLSWLEDYLQTEWPELEVYLASVTEQWAVATVCGPASSTLVAELFDDINPDPEAFPFMTVREGHVDGVPVRVFRISFSGEVSYEINIPARYGLWLWQRIMAHGKPHDITPYGTEAMHLLRAEKGYLMVGQDTDGTVTPFDLDMAWTVKKTADFVGRRSLFRSDTTRSDRRQWVGLLSEDPRYIPPEGAQILATARINTNGKTPMIGHVTSSYFSPTLKRSIALGFVEGGLDKLGETVFISHGSTPPRPAVISKKDFLANADNATEAPA